MHLRTRDASIANYHLDIGYTLDIWLNREWVSGCVEGDGQDYWLFVKTGGKFVLAECMKVRYREP
ncbi:DUF5348 domain-containing protein [Dictyobacter kobayashii]|uniref:DUF5348 domain-containing protein n=1 Tax=Dictyobacter kobayashii TaxID=2014872 RepID=UPI00138719E1